MQCRICFEEDERKNLICPCKCSGTGKYVHRECLNKWREINCDNENYKQCPTCKFKYKIKGDNNDYVDMDYYVKKKVEDKEFVIVSIFSLIYLVIVVILFYFMPFQDLISSMYFSLVMGLMLILILAFFIPKYYGTSNMSAEAYNSEINQMMKNLSTTEKFGFIIEMGGNNLLEYYTNSIEKERRSAVKKYKETIGKDLSEIVDLE